MCPLQLCRELRDRENNDFLSFCPFKGKRVSSLKGCGHKSFAQVVRFNTLVTKVIKSDQRVNNLTRMSHGSVWEKVQGWTEPAAIKQITVQ